MLKDTKIQNKISVKLIKILFVLLLLFYSCKKERPFEYSEELNRITGENLKIWLEKSPFNGMWNYSGEDKNAIVITNIEQVFPFLGKFKNENDDFDQNSYPDNDIYQKETIVFKDSSFGESFVYAALIYEPEELFLSDFYSEMGNVVLSGADAIYDSHNARLSETMICENKSDYKAAIYWVSSNYKTYLFGFYQNKNLVFQFGFPCEANQKLKAVQKIKQINHSLGLNIKEWAEITENKLETNQTPKSFWKDPYYPLYKQNFISQLKIKIKNTQFSLQKNQYAREKGVDYLFAYEEGNKEHTISFKLEKTLLSKQEYEKELEGFEYLTMNDLSSKKLFIKKEEVANGQVSNISEIYFKDNSILKIESNYPDNDLKAKNQIVDILSNLRISSY